MRTTALPQPHETLIAMIRRRVYADELVGAAEIAERLGLAQVQTVHLWRRRYPDFPKPVARLRQALTWNWPEVEAWARQTGRLEKRA
jgi:hypothetical protein